MADKYPLKKSRAAKSQIMDILREQGYLPYAKLADEYDFYITQDPDIVGYTVPGKYIIVLNGQLNDKQVSTIVRHEILHEYYEHMQRMTKLLSDEGDKVYDNHDLFNIAADFEISNKAYTEKDKKIARAIELGSRVLRGLVTEDEYPGWEDKSFEEMYREIAKRDPEKDEQLKKLIQQMAELNPKIIDPTQESAKQLQKQMNQQSKNHGEDEPQGGDGQPGEPDKDSDDKDGKGSKSVSTAKKKSGSSKKSDEIAKQAGEIDDELQDIKDEKEEIESGQDSVFPSEQEQKELERLAKKAERVRKIFEQVRKEGSIEKSNQEVIEKEKEEIKQEKERLARVQEIQKLKKLQADPLYKFTLNLDYFVRDQVRKRKQLIDYMNNPAYMNTDWVVDYTPRIKTKAIPLINVYWDVSGSFSSEEKTAGARRAIDTLDQYEMAGQIKTKKYYFADTVSDTEKGAGSWATRGAPILEHINITHPQNVIIITDSDIRDCRQVVKVPGAVWMLFYDGQSENLKQHLFGELETQYYLITRY